MPPLFRLIVLRTVIAIALAVASVSTLIALLGGQLPFSLVLSGGLLAVSPVGLFAFRGRLTIAKHLATISLVAVTLGLFLPQLRRLRVVSELARYTNASVRRDASYYSQLFRLTMPRCFYPVTSCVIKPGTNPNSLDTAVHIASRLPLVALDVKGKSLVRHGVDLQTHSDTRLSRSAFESIGRIKSLRSLRIRGVTTNGREIAELGGLHRLVRLDLSSCRMSDNGWDALSDLTQLKFVSLEGNTTVGDNAARWVGSLPNLNGAVLTFTKISKEGLRGFQMAKSSKLKYLLIASPFLDRAEIQRLRTKIPQVLIPYYGRGVYVEHRSVFGTSYGSEPCPWAVPRVIAL